MVAEWHGHMEPDLFGQELGKAPVSVEDDPDVLRRGTALDLLREAPFIQRIEKAYHLGSVRQSWQEFSLGVRDQEQSR